MGKLKKKALNLGITFQDDVTEEMLREMIAQSAPEEDEDDAVKPLTKSDLASLGQAIAQGIVAGTKDTKEEFGRETYAEPDPKDIGEWKTYYTPQFMWILPGRRVAGRVVQAPYGKIEFKMDRGAAVQTGMQWNTQYIATFSTNNKKVQAHIEASEYFNRKFFLSGQESSVSTDQMRYAEFFARRQASLSNTMAPELHRMGADLGLTLSHNMALTTLRTAIADKLAEQDMAAYHDKQSNIMVATGRAALLTPSGT